MLVTTGTGAVAREGTSILYEGNIVQIIGEKHVSVKDDATGNEFQLMGEALSQASACQPL